jgi:hypothetical protein
MAALDDVDVVHLDPGLRPQDDGVLAERGDLLQHLVQAARARELLVEPAPEQRQVQRRLHRPAAPRLLHVAALHQGLNQHRGARLRHVEFARQLGDAHRPPGRREYLEDAQDPGRRLDVARPAGAAGAGH